MPTVTRHEKYFNEGLEAILKLEQRPDFPPSPGREKLESYLDTLQEKEPIFMKVLYDDMLGYAQAAQEQGELEQRQKPAGKVWRVAQGVLSVPYLLAIGGTFALGRLTNSNSTLFYLIAPPAFLSLEALPAFYLKSEHPFMSDALLAYIGGSILLEAFRFKDAFQDLWFDPFARMQCSQSLAIGTPARRTLLGRVGHYFYNKRTIELEKLSPDCSLHQKINEEVNLLKENFEMVW